MTAPHANLMARLEELARQFREIESQLVDPELMHQPDRMRRLSVHRAAIAGIVAQYERYRELARQVTEHEGLAAGEDPELAELAREELPALRRELEALLEAMTGELVTADDRQIGALILEIRSAAGGDEAALWAGDLLGMYQAFAQRRGWRFEPLQHTAGDRGGVREAVVEVSGDGAWQGLGYEGGVHCVKRVPETESQGRVHTSTATVAVLPEPEAVEVDLDPSEVETFVTTAQGPGGQNVNKVATAVHLIHRPSGIEVRMQESKSQKQNREKAWRLLRARLHEKAERRRHAERSEDRVKMIGSGDRSERIRTYRYKENIAVDHRLGESFNLEAVLAGELGPVVDALVARDRARRLAAL